MEQQHPLSGITKPRALDGPRTGAPVGHGAVPSKQRLRTSQMGHFDPHELTRRLYMVLTDQKAHAERKRRARGDRRRDGPGGIPEKGTEPSLHRPAEAPSSLDPELRTEKSSRHRSENPPAGEEPTADSTEYHHVPREAAKQFTQTTTVEITRPPIHELSKRTIRYHMDGSRTVWPAGGPDTEPPLQQKQEKLLDRSQFHRTQILEKAAQRDQHEREQEDAAAARNRYTFQGELLRLAPDSHERRNSTGNGADMSDHPLEDNRRSLMGMEPLVDANEEATPPPESAAHEHRLGRTQSDESRHRPKLLLTPFLRKADSLWGLRVRLGSSKQDKGGGTASQEQPTPLKSPKSGFLAKFVSKR